MPYRSLREEELRLRLGWFVRIRWFFVAGFALAALFGYYVLGLRFSLGKILLTESSILVYNVGFLVYHRERRRRRSRPSLVRRRVEANLQIYLDLLHLTVLIHLLGGIESPFLSFYLFHAIIGSMLLSRAEVVLVGLVSFALCAAVTALEYHGVLPHHHFAAIFAPDAHRQGLTVLVIGAAFSIMLFATIAMSSTIVASLHNREKELVAVREALGKKSEDLEQANRVLREQQETLIRTEKLASLGELSAGIAHEINNPIQFIQGNMEIVREAMTDILPLLDEVNERSGGLTVARLDYPFFRQHIGVLINDMAEGALRIRDIVRDLKTFARGDDEGRLTDQVDVNEIVRACLRLLHNRLKRHEVRERLDPDLPLIRGNASRLEQVFVNMIANAADALSGRAGGLIEVSSGLEPDQTMIRATIRDNGSGMGEEVQRRLFDPFFTTKTRAGGSGLGLAISYAIVQEHAGRIEFQSQQGEGTSFHVLLPLERPQ